LIPERISFDSKILSLKEQIKEVLALRLAQFNEEWDRQWEQKTA
jgi:hypothetical protein